MRFEGTLAQWNDDRGFGFIQPTEGGQTLFAHISAFPRDGQRPTPNERLSFEVTLGQNGKKQAVAIERLSVVSTLNCRFALVLATQRRVAALAHAPAWAAARALRRAPMTLRNSDT